MAFSLGHPHDGVYAMYPTDQDIVAGDNRAAGGGSLLG
jgi:hypothetical protein